MPRRCPARVCFAVATVGRLRPSWDFAVRRRRAGGVLQRGGPKGQPRVCGLPVRVRVVSLKCLYSLGVLFRRFLALVTYISFSLVSYCRYHDFLGVLLFFWHIAAHAGPTVLLES